MALTGELWGVFLWIFVTVSLSEEIPTGSTYRKNTTFQNLCETSVIQVSLIKTAMISRRKFIINTYPEAIILIECWSSIIPILLLHISILPIETIQCSINWFCQHRPSGMSVSHFFLPFNTTTSDECNGVLDHLHAIRQLVQLTTNKSPKLHITGTLWEESTGDPHKGPVIHEASITACSGSRGHVYGKGFYAQDFITRNAWSHGMLLPINDWKRKCT